MNGLGLAGFGAGEIELTPKDGTAMTADMSLAMGAVGLRGAVQAAPARMSVIKPHTSDIEFGAR